MTPFKTEEFLIRHHLHKQANSKSSDVKAIYPPEKNRVIFEDDP